MKNSFVSVVLEALAECGAAPVVVELTPRYSGLFGDRCPDCDTPAGQEHAAGCTLAEIDLPRTEEQKERQAG